MKQARDYMFHIVDVLKKDKNLIQLDGKYKFQLKFPYGHGVVFTRLYSKDFIKEGLYSVIEPNLCLTRDEIDPEKEGFSEEILMEKILNMFVVPYRLKEPLSMKTLMPFDIIYFRRFELVPNLKHLFLIKISYYYLFMILKRWIFIRRI